MTTQEWIVYIFALIGSSISITGLCWIAAGLTTRYSKWIHRDCKH